MGFERDEFKDIGEHQIAYFGGPGKMLLPSRATVEAMIRRIPEHKLMTTDLLRQKLAEQFDVQGTCPVTTKKVLTLIANESSEEAAYWRVIKQNGELMAYYPGGQDSHAAHLKDEGFSIETKGKVSKVRHFKAGLVHFE